MFRSPGARRRLTVSGTSTSSQLIALRAMAVAASVGAASRLKALPALWVGALSRMLTRSNDELTREAVAVARAVTAPKDSSVERESALLRVAHDPARTPAVRLDALTARAPGATLDPDLFELVRTSLEPAQPASLRAAAAVVARSQPRSESSCLRSRARSKSQGRWTCHPCCGRLATRVRRGGVGDDDGARPIEGAVEPPCRGPASSARELPDSVKKAGETLLTSISVDAAKEAARLETLLTTVQGGDVGRGQTVFNGSKAACLSCHAIGYIGGRIGRTSRKSARSAASAIFSRRSCAQVPASRAATNPLRFARDRARCGGGVLRNDALDEVVLANATGGYPHPPRDVADIEPETVSLMPPGYAEMLTRQELADLLAFLRAAK